MKKEFFKNKMNLILLSSFVFFIFVKIFGFGFKFSDENIYFDMGRLILKGIFPYKDFFFASPPLQITLYAFLLTIFKNPLFLKIVPIIASIISSFFLFKIVEKEFNKKAGLASAILYLFSFVILTTTDHSTGVHLTAMFLIISLYFTQNKKFFIAGCLASLSLLTRLYAGVAVLGILIYVFIKNKKDTIKYILGLIAIFLGTNLILFLFFKTNYFDSVIFYNLLKSTGISKGKIFSFFILHDSPIILLTIISIFIIKEKNKLMLWIPAITTLLFYIFYADIYYLYLGILIPFLSAISGITLEKISRDSEKPLKILIIILSIIVLLNSFLYISTQANEAKITFAKDIVNFVKENSNTGDLIYGSFELTPLISILSGREIANNYIDTNEKTFLTGMYNLKNRTKELNGKVKFIILKVTINSMGQIVNMEKIIDPNFIKSNCTLVKEYPIPKDYSSNAVLVFDCKKKI